MAEDVTVWGIHAGKTGDADLLFLKKGYVGVGWDRIGDLSKIEPNREAFKARVADAYPEFKPGAVPTGAGQMFRFVHVMKPGDIVVYPSKGDHQIHIGRVQGPYQYDPALEPGYPSQRRVKWLRTVPRESFSTAAMHELGASLSLFQVKSHANEFLAVLERIHSAVPGASLADQILRLISDSEASWRERVAAADARIAELVKENEELGAKLDSEPGLVDGVIDEGLRRRVTRLTAAPVDTVMREAGVVLEDRFRRIAGSEGRSEQGVGLVRVVLDPGKPKLVFSTHRGEQTGVLKLYEGAVQFIRNPPMHKLMDYSQSSARLHLRLIDSLLLLLEEGGQPGPDDLELVRRMLTRRPVPDGQLAIYRALYSAGEHGMTRSQLASATERTTSEVSGVLGSLGNRINKTEGLEGADGINLVLDCRRRGTEWWYRMKPVLRQALKAEGLG